MFNTHAGLGHELGSLVGEFVGLCVGALDGLAVVGCTDGDDVGRLVVGLLVGVLEVGEFVGLCVCSLVVGNDVGRPSSLDIISSTGPVALWLYDTTL